MELGIFAKTFRRPNAQATLEAVQALGLGCVQFNFECGGLPSMPEEVPPLALATIGAASRDTRVRLAALSGTFNMAHPEPAVRKGGLLRLRVVAEAAAQLGIPLVTLCTGTRDRAGDRAGARQRRVRCAPSAGAARYSSCGRPAPDHPGSGQPVGGGAAPVRHPA